MTFHFFSSLLFQQNARRMTREKKEFAYLQIQLRNLLLKSKGDKPQQKEKRKRKEKTLSSMTATTTTVAREKRYEKHKLGPHHFPFFAYTHLSFFIKIEMRAFSCDCERHASFGE